MSDGKVEFRTVVTDATVKDYRFSRTGHLVDGVIALSVQSIRGELSRGDIESLHELVNQGRPLKIVVESDPPRSVVVRGVRGVVTANITETIVEQADESGEKT